MTVADGMWTPGLAGEVLDEVIVRLAVMARQARESGDLDTHDLCITALERPTVLGAIVSDIIQSRGGVRPTLRVIDGGRS